MDKDIRFTLQNGASGVATVLPPHLMIEKVSILKNSNSLANDIYDWDIWFYNLHRYYNDYNLDVANLYHFGVGTTANANIVSYQYVVNGSTNNIIELPISLNRSYIPSNLINDSLVLRVYMKGNVCYDGL